MNTDFYKQQLLNILDDKLFFQDLIDCNGWIAGGAILSIVTNKEVNDIDLYFESLKGAYEFYLRSIDNGYFCYCETTKSLLLTKSGCPNLNLVLFDFFDSSQAIFDSFDFTVCKASFNGVGFYFDESFWGDVASRRLIYTPSFRFPLSTALRIQKYENKGYKISRNEYIKIILQITQRKIESLEDLEEELCGIYGINLSEHFKDIEDDFSVDKVIERLGDIHFDITKTENALNVDNQSEPKIFADCGDVIKIKDDVLVKKLNLNTYEGEKEPLNFPLTVYKWVKKKDDKYFSHSSMSGEFEYKKGKFVKDTKSRGLNVLFEENVDDHNFSNNKDTCKIKLLVMKSEDLKIECGELTATEAFFVDEVEFRTNSLEDRMKKVNNKPVAPYVVASYFV